jgi:hypothetical protein
LCRLPVSMRPALCGAETVRTASVATADRRPWRLRSFAKEDPLRLGATWAAACRTGSAAAISAFHWSGTDVVRRASLSFSAKRLLAICNLISVAVGGRISAGPGDRSSKSDAWSSEASAESGDPRPATQAAIPEAKINAAITDTTGSTIPERASRASAIDEIRVIHPRTAPCELIVPKRFANCLGYCGG